MKKIEHTQSPITSSSFFRSYILVFLMASAFFFFADVTSAQAAFSLTTDTNKSAGTTVTLPLRGNTDVLINWGDGTATTTVTNANLTTNTEHTYASEGIYNIAITGTLTQFGSDYNTYPNAEKITAVNSWSGVGLTSLAGAFRGATNLTVVPTTLPSTVNNLSVAFYGATNFNYDISGWDTSKVTTMDRMFLLATTFNQPLNSWNTSKVGNMNSMFSSATAFNRDLSSWCTSLIGSKPSGFDTSASAWTGDPGTRPQWGTCTVTSSSTISNHTNSQAGNAFDYQNKTTETLFAFSLQSNSGVATAPNLMFALSGLKNINVTDFRNFKLYRDVNSNGAYDAGDTQVAGVGVMSILDKSGTIIFADDLVFSTAENYILIADWDAPINGSFMSVDLFSADLDSTDTYGTQKIFGEVSSARHLRNNRGGGGSLLSIGPVAPAGDAVVSGGVNTGGDAIDTNIGGGLIGNSPGFYWPTANSGSWTNPASAYDKTDGTYSTVTSQLTSSFFNYNFSVTGSQIDGIAVKLEFSGTTAAGNIGAELSWNGGVSWTATGNVTPTATSTDAVFILGGVSDLWGRTWSIADFSNANFRIRLTGNPSANTIQLDALQVQISHSTSGGGGGGGGAI